MLETNSYTIYMIQLEPFSDITETLELCYMSDAVIYIYVIKPSNITWGKQL